MPPHSEAEEIRRRIRERQNCDHEFQRAEERRKFLKDFYRRKNTTPYPEKTAAE